MAYMDQERKAKLAANLKQVMPKGWKYSLGVRNHMVIVLNIWSAPIDLLGAFTSKTVTHIDVNPYHPGINDAHIAKQFENIFRALNDGNHDNSDVMSDYFDVGWYVDVNVGRWDRPFVCTAAKEIAL